MSDDESQAAAITLVVPGQAVKRLPLAINEVSHVLGGGLVPGSLILLAGDPGIGKSTLVLQMTAGLTRTQAERILYVCGEESPEQIGLRLERLKLAPEQFSFLADTNIKSIVATIKKHRPRAVVVDSIQTMADPEVESEPGSLVQIRLSTGKLLQLAKQENIPIIIIGHVTKEGVVAGPRLLEHMVDVVLYLEGDGVNEYRLLRCVKNRFGPTNQVGVFTMDEAGLREVKNPSELFLSQSPEQIPGSVVSVIMEGSRPFLLEIQALTNKTSFGYPKRAASGFELSRLELILAVLQRRAGLKLENQDVFLNIVGGLRVKDPGLDLAAGLAIASSLANQAMPVKSIALGELGLGGEVRPVAHLVHRVSEAARLGFTNFYLPEQTIDKEGAKIYAVKNIGEGLMVLGIEK